MKNLINNFENNNLFKFKIIKNLINIFLDLRIPNFTINKLTKTYKWN